MPTLLRLFSYARPRSLILWAIAMTLGLIGMIILASGSSPLLYSLTAGVSLLLWLPLLYDLLPVIWHVLQHGNWPSDRRRYLMSKR